MRPLRKLTIFILTLLALLAALLAGYAGAAPSMENLTPRRAYSGEFSDVPAAAWYRNDVVRLWELGVADGAEGLFRPDELVTRAEAAAFAARLLRLYETASPILTKSDPWYKSAFDALEVVSMLPEGWRSAPSATLTRTEAASFIVRLLPARELSDVNPRVVELWRRGYYAGDVRLSTPGREDILKAYSLGLCGGVGERADFEPVRAVTRAELAAMLSRLSDPDRRVRLAWDETKTSVAECSMASLITETPVYTAWHGVNNERAAVGNLAYMLSADSLTLTLHKDNATLGDVGFRTELRELLSLYQRCVMTYFFEQTCGSIVAGTSMHDGGINVTLRFGFIIEPDDPHEAENRRIREGSVELAARLHDELWSSGALDSAMNEFEMAEVYRAALLSRCVIGSDAPWGPTALGPLMDGAATEEGFVRALMLLLKMEGISCRTESSPDEIVIIAALDGVEYPLASGFGVEPEEPDGQF